MKKILFILIICCLSVIHCFAQLETMYVIRGKNGIAEKEWRRFTINADSCSLKVENVLVTKHYEILDFAETKTDSLNIYRLACMEGDKILHKITIVTPNDNSKREMYMLIDNIIVNGRDLGFTYYATEPKIRK